jgi:excisionase family DNA binding protein
MRTINRRRESLIDIDEVASRLGVSTRYVRRLVAERRIAYLKVGRLLRFNTDVVDAWLDTCAVQTVERGPSSPAARQTKPAQASSDPPKPNGADTRARSTPHNAKARQSR